MPKCADIGRVISKDEPIPAAVNQGLGGHAFRNVWCDEMYEAINPPNVPVRKHTLHVSDVLFPHSMCVCVCVNPGWGERAWKDRGEGLRSLLLAWRIVQSAVESGREDAIYGVGHIADGQSQGADSAGDGSRC